VGTALGEIVCWLADLPRTYRPMFESGSVREFMHLILHFPERAYRGRMSGGVVGMGAYSH